MQGEKLTWRVQLLYTVAIGQSSNEDHNNYVVNAAIAQWEWELLQTQADFSLKF